MESRKRAEAIANGEKDSQFYDCSDDEVHPHVRGILESTGGHLYKAIKQTVAEYPIPGIRMSRSTHESSLLLDCGCNWGRWTFSAARNGFRSIGIDPSLHAVIAARQIRRSLKLPCTFVVGDCRYLPFSDAVFSHVFSYSVVQHFSRADAALAANDFAQVTASGGECMLQMPNFLGIRCLYHQAKRGFREGNNFDARYYSIAELKRLFEPFAPHVSLSVDGFFGLGIQSDDRKYMPRLSRLVIDASEFLRGVTSMFPPLIYLADSVYLHGKKI